MSCQLIDEVAKSKNKQVEIIICDATDSWQHFENKDLAHYELCREQYRDRLFQRSPIAYKLRRSAQQILFDQSRIQKYQAVEFGGRTCSNRFGLLDN